MKQFIVLKSIFLYIIFFCIRVVAFTQPFPDFQFSRLSEKDGLSSNIVNSIAQDDDGIIWASTVNGLNRYDGYGFTRFYANPYDSNSIAANEINSIQCGHQNNLWMVTVAGVCSFNTITQKAQVFRSGNETPAPFRIYDGSTIWFDSGKNQPYIVSPSALYHFTDSLHYKLLDIDFPVFFYKGISISAYNKIVSDKNGQLWAFRQNRIYKINNVSKKVEREFDCPYSDIAIYDVLFDSFNRCWVSTWSNGIYQFKPDENSWESLPLRHVVNPLIKDGVEWKWNGKMFLVYAINPTGLLFVDEESLEVRFYPLIGQVGVINTPFVDRQNILWVPTSDGIYYYAPSNNLFDISRIYTSNEKESNEDWDLNIAYDMSEEPSGYWVSMRYLGGILWFNKDWKLKKFFPILLEGFGKAFDAQLATTREGYDFKQAGNLMYVTTEWGMVTIDLHTFQKKIYQCPWTKPIMRLRTIVTENKDKWWVRSFDQGVFVFNPQTQQFIRHYNLGKTCKGCDAPSANYLVRDMKGRIFVSTNVGLFKFDNTRDTFLLVHPKGKLVMGSSLMGMAIDGNGLIWIGSDNGIIAYNADSDKVVKIFSENNRIGQVQRIAIDSVQNVWFNSVSGYWCWLRKQDKIIQFKFNQGLPYNDGGLFYTTSDGSVYAGGSGGMVRFYPDRLMSYNITAKTKIVDAMVNDKHFLFGKTSSGEKELVLNPDENNIEIRFDVINYDQPDNNLFYYRLKPGQEVWKQIDNGKLSFNNMPAGQYELAVRGGNKLTGTFTGTDVLYLTIKPHWYQSWWFIFLCIIIAGLIIFYIVKRRIRFIRKQANFKQKIAETEMTALRSQMNPHFIFNSLNSIEYYILHNEKRNASIYLNKFASLIRIILSDSRKDVVPFADDMQTIRLYVDLEQIRFNHSFQYITDIEQPLQDSDYLVPPLLIQPFVENAIIHGFGHSDKNDLRLKISAFIRGEYIVYIIEDNGAGRKKSSEINALNRPNHISVGLQITQQRISIFNERHKANSTINIEDLYDDRGNPSGTRVTVKIKTN